MVINITSNLCLNSKINHCELKGIAIGLKFTMKIMIEHTAIQFNDGLTKVKMINERTYISLKHRVFRVNHYRIRILKLIVVQYQQQDK